MIDKNAPHWQGDLADFIQNDVDGRFWFEDQFRAALDGTLRVAEGVNHAIRDRENDIVTANDEEWEGQVEDSYNEAFTDGYAEAESDLSGKYDEVYDAGYEDGYEAGQSE